MRFTKHNSKRSLGFENLETRAMMAGDVKVSVDTSGNLLIKGDTKDNFIVVSQLNDGRFKVAGVPLTKTTINGRSSDKFTVTGGLEAALVGGNDGIAILKGNFNGEVIINTGNGIDGVALTKVNALGVEVNTGAHTDLVFAAFVNVFGSDLESSLASTAAPQPFGAFNVNTGSGNDYVLLTKVFADSICVLTGDGNDAVGLLFVGARSLKVDLGSGDYNLLGVGASEAGFADFSGGGTLDAYVYARNEFGGSDIRGFEYSLSLDAYVDQVENYIKLLEPLIRQLPGIKNLPNFSM